MEKTKYQADLSSEEISRYARHISLPEIGVQGQIKLKTSSIACIGTGGLGSPLLIYLAAAGIGRIGIVDFDVVEYSNLQRQIIHTTNSIGLLSIRHASLIRYLVGKLSEQSHIISKLLSVSKAL